MSRTCSWSSLPAASTAASAWTVSVAASPCLIAMASRRFAVLYLSFCNRHSSAAVLPTLCPRERLLLHF